MSSFFSILSKLFFALTIILIPFRWRMDVWLRPMPPLYGDYTNYLLFASDITLIYTLVFWICNLILHPRLLKLGNKLIVFCLFGLVFASSISVFGSVDPILSRYHVARMFLLLLLYLYILNTFQSPVWVIVPIALQVIIQAPIAIAQSLMQHSLGLQIFGEYSLDPQILGTSIIPVADMRFLRAYGLSDHPNILGGCIAFALVLLLAVVIYSKERTAIIFSAMIFLLAFPALLLTFSRSAWLSLFVASSFILISEASARRWESWKRASILGLLSVIIVLPFLSNHLDVFQKRVTTNAAEDGPMQERAYLLQAGNTLFVEHSAIGIGLGATPLAMKNRFEVFLVNYQPPHYVPLLAALETGVLGGFFYLMLTLFPILWFFVNRKTFIHQPVIMGASALLIVIFVVSLFDYYTWYTTGRIWQWLAWSFYALALEKGTTPLA